MSHHRIIYKRNVLIFESKQSFSFPQTKGYLQRNVAAATVYLKANPRQYWTAITSVVLFSGSVTIKCNKDKKCKDSSYAFAYYS